MFPLPNAGTDVEIRLINIICSEVAAESYLKNTVCMFIFAIVAAIFMGLTARIRMVRLWITFTNTDSAKQ